MTEQTSKGFTIGNTVQLENVPSNAKAFLEAHPNYEDKRFKIIDIDWRSEWDDEQGNYMATVLTLVDVDGDETEAWLMDQKYVKEKKY